MRKGTILLLVALCAAALAGGAALWDRLTPQVTVADVTRGPAVEVVYATGIVEPVLWAKVSPVVTGRIAEILAREGERVQPGQVIARLDDREARARLLELEARERYWREAMNRQRDLSERGIASREVLDKTQSEYLSAQALTSAARQKVQDLTIVAPMTGVVLRQDGEIGEVVEVKNVLYWIGQPKPLRITADVDEEDIARIRAGQTVLIKADAFPGQVLEGKVAEITPKGDPVNKSFRVRVRLPDDSPVMVGMTTEINIVTHEVPDALLLPVAALRDGKVFVAEGDVARLRAVSTGIRGRDSVQITGGLTGGEQVVLDPPAKLADGGRIRVNRSPPAPSGPNGMGGAGQAQAKS